MAFHGVWPSRHYSLCIAFHGADNEEGILLWPGASQWRIYYHRMWVQLWTTCSNLLKQPNGELLVVVNHNQLRTMASETVDPIDWSHPLPSWAVPPVLYLHCINQRILSGTRTCNRSMRGNHLAYAATQGISRFHSGYLLHYVKFISRKYWIPWLGRILSRSVKILRGKRN